ncbi:MAG TPA: hypothetical protein VF880_19295 [Actinomycetes bacterium]|jgi:hypothetical protein
MSWRPYPQRPPVAPWYRLLRELFTDPAVVRPSGVGGNVTEAVYELARAVDRLAQALDRFRLGQDGDDPQ